MAPLKDTVTREPLLDIANATQVRLFNQFQILKSLQSRIEDVLADLEGAILAQIEVDELRAADKLRRISGRAAGSLAGVVLERHLQRIALNHKIAAPKKSPTIADLNDPLRAGGVYDVTVWRRIRHLADIRNLCSHQKDREPTDEEIVDLITGVRSVVAQAV